MKMWWAPAFWEHLGGEHSGGNVGNLENLMGTHLGEKTKKKIPQSLTKPNRKTNLGLPNFTCGAFSLAA